MVSNHSQKSTKNIINKVHITGMSVLTKHANSIAVLLDYCKKFLTVLFVLSMICIFIVGISNVFFLKKVELGVFQILTSNYVFLYFAEKRKNDQLEVDIHAHKHAVSNLVGIIQKVADGTHVLIEEKSSKKEKIVN